MQKILMIAAVTAFMVVPATLNAQERTFTGAAIGAGTGAVIGGPPGAVIGGVAGAVIGGPRLSSRRAYARGYRTCWRNRYGQRVCRYR